MAKIMNIDEVTKQKDAALANLNAFLDELLASENSHHNKKVSLLSYWLDEYVKYIQMEEIFDSTKLKAYKRGDIVKLNFGFNVGSEYGGLHYAIVINNRNPRNSSVLTVVPLTSQKEGSEVHPDDVYLGSEIYRSLKLKHDTISQHLHDEKEEIEKMLGEVERLLDRLSERKDPEVTADEEISDSLKDTLLDVAVIEQMKKEWLEKKKENEKSIRQLKRIQSEISRMKEGSIALVDQMTTVSKMRIYDPRNARGVLSGIRLSPELLDKVNNKIKELFVFGE